MFFNLPFMDALYDEEDISFDDLDDLLKTSGPSSGQRTLIT